jgi:hypothetical protein
LIENEEELNEVDPQVLQLKETLLKIDFQIKKLEMEINQLNEEVKKNIQNKNKSKWILKKKYLLEEILSKRNISHMNLIQILSAIDTSHSNIEIQKVLKNGAETLKKLNSKLTDMNVENVINSASEALSDYSEIQEAMNQTILEDLFDEEELEIELKALTLEDKKEEYILIPFEEIKGSKSILEWEIQELEKIENKELIKYKEDLKLGLKLLKLKIKRRNQTFIDHLNEMKEHFETKAIEEEGSKKSLKFMKYVELIELDLKELNETIMISPRKVEIEPSKKHTEEKEKVILGK